MPDQHVRVGNYLFADLSQLDLFIGRWASVCDSIRENGIRILQAIRPVTPPAGDGPSRRQATTYVESLRQARRHNDAMRDYAEAYLDRLRASRARYAATERDNAHRVLRAGGT